tara:strand:- start:209 stop:466 length:258 start_codon:yes stop_codon:yes gene_type:complete
MEKNSVTSTTSTNIIINNDIISKINGIQKDINIPNTLYSISNSIEIPQTKLNSEYSLNKNFFDPNECSPPNEWNNRLKNRINNYF